MGKELIDRQIQMGKRVKMKAQQLGKLSKANHMRLTGWDEMLGAEVMPLASREACFDFRLGLGC